MNDNLNYKTFLFISLKKFIISVENMKNENLYRDELIVNESLKDLNLDDLDLFLNNNIFKIEKKLKKFITKIYIILDSKKIFPIEMSIKEKINEKVLNLKNLNHLLQEGKTYCKKTLDEKIIIHMIINNYQINGKIYSFFPENERSNNFSVDIKFICISNNVIEDYENILKKYQISLGQVLSANYIKQFLGSSETNVFVMAQKIMGGINQNEVKLVDKTPKNKGFFEKFFNFFS